MSLQCMLLVLEHYPAAARPAEKLLALCLAEHASEDGQRIYPGVARLARLSAQSKRAVQAHIKRMVDRGWLCIVQPGGGRGRATVYRINPLWIDKQGVHDLEKPARPNSSTVQDTTGNRATDELANRTSINRQLNQNREGTSLRTAVVDRPSDVDEQVWKDWLQLRRTKRAPVTQTAVNAARAEAQRAHMPLNAFLREWCMRGSQGLKAEWLQHDRQANGQNKQQQRNTTIRELMGPSAEEDRHDEAHRANVVDADVIRIC